MANLVVEIADEGMIAVRVDPALKVALVAEAKNEGRSMTKQLERILRERYGSALAERGVGVAQLAEHPSAAPPGVIEEVAGSSPAPATRSASADKIAAGTDGNHPTARPEVALAQSRPPATREPRAKKCTHPTHGRKGWKCKGCGEMA